MTKSKSDHKAAAALRVAREVLGIELGMEHRDSERSIRVDDLKKALEQAYELGRRGKGGLSLV